MKEITFDRFVRYLFTIAVCVLLYLLIAKLSKVLTPFFVAWLVAYLLYPIVCFFQYRCKLKFRLLAIFVTLLVVAGLIYLTGMLIVPSFIEEYKRMESIIVEFMGEGLLLGGIGGLLGSVCGFVFAQAVSMNVFNSSIQFHWLLIPVTVLVSVLVTGLSCLLPVRSATDVDPALVLKGE